MLKHICPATALGGGAISQILEKINVEMLGQVGVKACLGLVFFFNAAACAHIPLPPEYASMRPRGLHDAYATW